jgi:polyphosphate kinase
MFFNRELSWLKFNERVVREADLPDRPILERLKFCAIFSSNLDEFFMVRDATILDQIKVGYEGLDPSDMRPQEVFDAIHAEVNTLTKLQEAIERRCLEDLGTFGIYLVERKALTLSDLKALKVYFDINVFPVLTPMGVDFSRPFPLIANKSTYIAVKLMVDGIYRLALVQVPTGIDRFIALPSENAVQRYCLLEDVITLFLNQLFIGFEVLSSCIFRITRNGDINLIEEGAEDLLDVIEEAIKSRKWGEVIRLEIEAHSDAWLLNVIMTSLQVKDNQVFYTTGIIDKTLWFRFNPPGDRQKLSAERYVPRTLPYMSKKNIFKTIREGDVFLHHPYESFDYVVNFIKQASKDDNVLAIKQTLYRVSGNSEIVKALGDAAEKGKQVTVLVELMARFDEENNINWAKKLEQKGAHVIYGLYGLKTHSKITLVVRREKQKIKRYVHLGTGNYNDQTAKLYTDMGLFTCKESIGVDASVFFNMISGFTQSIQTHTLTVAPYQMREHFIKLIDREKCNAEHGKKGHIIAKMNSLVDEEIVRKLYEASQKGVKIELIVRGICTLVPGVKGLSETISVTSIVGEFLEHSRVYYFLNDHNSEIYLSSADWMTRNLNRRVELLFPIEDAVIAERIKRILALELADTKKAWRLKSDGYYVRKTSDTGTALSAQEVLKTLPYDDDQTFINALKERM